MTIPAPALMLGLAGILPFAWGAATALSPALAAILPVPRLVGQAVLVGYGSVILCFMSGVLWGFVASSGTEQHRWRGYALSVVPALWVFFAVTPGPQGISALLVGFLVLLASEAQFGLWGLTPPWWMRLRLVLTAGVAVCLAIGLGG